MTRHRLGTFDALRGLAAAAVVLLHLEEVNLSGPVLPHAFFAVDFFFALSGFVIAYTYEDKLRGGLSAGAFLMRRVIRLYPMIAFGVCFGTFVLGMKLLSDPGRVDPLGSIVTSALSNLFLFPTPFVTPASRGVLFMTDGPLWSVTFEILVNIVWCIALVRASNRVLASIVGLCLACLILFALRTGTTDIGFDWATMPGGLARVGFGFGVGLLAYRLRSRLIFVQSGALKLASGLVLLSVFAVPRMPGLDLAYDLACITLVVPLILVLGLNGADHPRIDKLLGDASYPLYAIHFPILLLASGVHQKVPQLNLYVLLAGTGIAMLLATELTMKLYDEPVRNALAAWWAKRERRAAAVPDGPLLTGQ